MKVLDGDSSLGRGPTESKKRRREVGLIVALSVFFLILTWVAFRVYGLSSRLPTEHSIFFFGLVNFNIILFLFLIFLIFRNIVKSFAERQGGVVGSSLKSKLIAAFVTFSFVPTTIMFFVSVFYINNSFDKWFSEKTVGVMKSSLEVMTQYYSSAKKRNYHFADVIRGRMSLVPPKGLNQFLKQQLELYQVDAIELYPSLLGDRSIAISDNIQLAGVPEVSLEFRNKGIGQKVEASYIHHFGEGNLVRVIKPIKWQGQNAALVVSSFIPLSLISRLNDINQTYEDFKGSNSLSYPLKSIYLIILVLMTLVILLGATWFGFYLAKQLTIPMVLLGTAAQKVAEGDYHKVKVQSGSPEVNELVRNFNLMSANLEKSRSQIQKSNSSLRRTLDQLDEYARYIEVVLANISTGVISVNKNGKVTMVNRHAANLLDVNASEFVSKRVNDIIDENSNPVVSTLLSALMGTESPKIQREVRVEIGGRSVPLQMSVSIMKDEKGNDLGRILVFDDLTLVVNAQRAAAWTEVARRIAHEIKNPLTPISLAAQRLQRKFGQQIGDKAFSECTHMIIDQVDSMKTLVNEFSNFARLPKSNPQVGDLSRVIHDSISVFEPSQKEVKFVQEDDVSLPHFLFDADQIKRVFTNLIDNALSALQGTQKPVIKIYTKYDDQLKIVRVNVEDNGKGIATDIRDHIFEPYVTTKKQGTGLGLAIVKRTVEDHNGFIRAFPQQPRGTKIVIELPVIVADTGKAKVPSPNINL